MGFGHRGRKNFDPCAGMLKNARRRTLEKPGLHGPLLDLALRLEKRARDDHYFIERKLYTNANARIDRRRQICIAPPIRHHIPLEERG
jgi:citrate synthase